MKRIVKNLEKLNQPAKPLEFITDIGTDTTYGNEIISALKEVLNAKSDVIALAAPQIGYDARIFCIKFNDVIKTFINPIITKKSGGTIAPETFCSMPGKEILISRPDEITVVYYTDEFKYEDNKLLGPAARLFDQQCQLLDGILPSDLGLVSDVEEDGSLADLTENEIKQVQEIYKEFVKTKIKAIEASIKEDEDLAKYYKSLQFSESVINGRTQVIDETAEERAKAMRAAQKANNRRVNQQVKQTNKAELAEFLRKKGR